MTGGAVWMAAYDRFLACDGLLRTEIFYVVSLGETAVADEGRGYADEGEEVLGFAFVAAVEASAAGQSGDGSFNDPTVPLRAMR